MTERFQADRYVGATFLRGVPGLIAIAAAALHSLLIAGVALVLAVWADALAGWIARRCSLSKTPSVTTTELLVDLVCFIWAPAQFVLAQTTHPAALAGLAVFVAAGLFRLARFGVEGLINGRYRGLPVTYNGYIFPLAALANHYDGNHAPALFATVLVVVSALMVSRKLTVPELG